MAVIHDESDATMMFCLSGFGKDNLCYVLPQTIAFNIWSEMLEINSQMIKTYMERGEWDVGIDGEPWILKR